MDEYITFRDIEQIFKMSRPTVYRLMKQGKIKSYKIGKMRRFKFKEIEAFFQSNSQLRQNVEKR